MCWDLPTYDYPTEYAPAIYAGTVYLGIHHKLGKDNKSLHFFTLKHLLNMEAYNSQLATLS